MSLSVLIAGQKWFGAEVFRALRALPGVEIAAVSAPRWNRDRLTDQADLYRLPVIPAGELCHRTMPDGIDLIVAAHSHDFVGEKTRHRAKFGGIGYHPSLLPIHRGRDAVQWAIKLRERITGGTVYRLSNRMDGGDILAQSHVFIRQDDTADELWRRDLAPLGVRLLVETVARFAREGYVIGTPQDENLATWEPSLDAPPAYRPDLLLLPGPDVTHGDETLEDMIASLGRCAHRARLWRNDG